MYCVSAKKEEGNGEGETGGDDFGGDDLVDDDMAEDSNVELSQSESELQTNSQIDMSFEVEDNSESPTKREPEPEVDDKVEEYGEISVSNISSQDVKPEIKPPVVKEENEDQVLLLSSY
jgi:hypothetical protein